MEGPDLQDALGDALSDTFRRVEAGMLTRWVVLAESIDEDGQRGLWLITQEDARAWDTIGMLTYALHLEQARTVAREPKDE
jgi:hypothetical protein